MTINSELSTPEPRRNKNKISRQLKQEQIHRNRDYMEVYQCVGSGGRMEEKVQGIRSINGRYKVDRGRLRIVGKWRSQRTYMYDPWT